MGFILGARKVHGRCVEGMWKACRRCMGGAQKVCRRCNVNDLIGCGEDP